MHDMFNPVANVMTVLQGLSIPSWKANMYVKKVIKWLTDAPNECHIKGNMDFFPTVKKNMEVQYAYQYTRSAVALRTIKLNEL